MLVVLGYILSHGRLRGRLRRVRVGLRMIYNGGIGFGMPVAASALSITVAMLAAFTAFTVFAFAVSGRDVVPWTLVGVVRGPWIMPVIGVGNKRLAGLGSRCIHFGSLIAIWLSIRGEIWVRIPMYIHVSAPMAGTLVPSSMAVTGGPMVAPSTLALAPTPRDARTRARTRGGSYSGPRTYA